jgi:hypothetical protein
MTIKEIFVQQLNNFERVEISYFHRKHKILFFALVLGLVLIQFLLAVKFYPFILPLFFLSVSFLVIAKIVFTLYQMISCVALIGDSLVLKNSLNQHCVTSVKCIRTMKSKRIGSTTITFIEFYLDGLKRKALLISENTNFIEPEEAIRSAQQLFEK